MKNKKSVNLYKQALVYGAKRGLDDDEIDVHFIMSKSSQFKNEEINTNLKPARNTRSLRKNFRKM